MHGKFSSRLDARILGVYPRAEVVEGKELGVDNASAALLAWFC